MPLAAQVVVISGQVNYQGTSVPFAPIQVCAVTSSGTPCTPVSSLFYDYNLANHAPNPTSTDASGNYTFYAASLPAPSFYIVQVTPTPGTVWSYVVGTYVNYGNGTVNPGTTGQIAYYPSNGTAVSGETTVPITAGGTSAITPASANLNITGVTQTGTLGTSSQVSTFPGTVAAGTTYPVTIGGATGSCSGKVAMADGTGCVSNGGISLTTTGTSGAATYSGGVLNVPVYQAALTNPVTGPGSGATVGHLAVMGNTSGTSITDGGAGTANQVWGMNSGATAQGWQTVSVGSMTWPAGGAGIPNYNGSSAWGTSYNSSNQIPANFLNLSAYAPLSGAAFTGAISTPGFTLNGGTEWTSSSSLNSQVVTCPTGGTGTQVCDASGAWVANGSGSGVVNSGSGYAFPAYGSAAGTTVGPSNVTTDATGNNENIPGTLAVGASGNMTLIATTATIVADLPAASSYAPTTIGSNITYFYAWVPDQSTCGPLTGGGGNLMWVLSTGSAWICSINSVTTSHALTAAATGGAAPGSSFNGSASVTFDAHSFGAPGLATANTYTAGDKQTVSSSSTTAGFNFAGVASDPSSLAIGDMWRNTTVAHLKFYDSTSTTQTLAELADIPSALPPNGSASGDLSGSYPGPTVAQIEGAAIPASAPLIGTNGSKQIIAATPHQMVQPLQCADTSSSATTYTCTTTPTLSSLTKGDTFILTSINQNNTAGTVTLNVDSIGAMTISKWQNSVNSLAAGDLQASGAAMVIYDGTYFEMTPIGNAPSGGGGGGSGGQNSVYLTSNQTDSTGSPVTTTMAMTSIPAGTQVIGSCGLQYQSNTTAAGMNYYINANNAPTNLTINASSQSASNGSASPYTISTTSSGTTQIGYGGTPLASTRYQVNFQFHATAPSGGLVLTPYFDVATGGDTATVLAGSWCQWTADGGGSLTLTTTGTSGAATYSGGVLNVPVYSGGGGITSINGNTTAAQVINSPDGTLTVNSTTTSGTTSVTLTPSTYWTSPIVGSTGTFVNNASTTKVQAWGFIPTNTVIFSNIYTVANTTDATNVYTLSIANAAGTLICHPTTATNVPAANTVWTNACSEGTATIYAGQLYVLLGAGTGTTAKIFGATASDMVGPYQASSTSLCTNTSGVLSGTCSFTIGAPEVYSLGLPNFALH